MRRMLAGPSFVDLFAGAGGLSSGLTAAGWHCAGAADHWEDATRTYAANFPDHTVVNLDVHDLKARRLHAFMPERPDWIVGGPPCQGYSTVGKRDRTDPRNELFLQFRRIVKSVKPGAS